MAAKKISELPDAATVTGADLIPLVQGGATVKATAAGLPVSTAAQAALDVVESGRGVRPWVSGTPYPQWTAVTDGTSTWRVLVTNYTAGASIAADVTAGKLAPLPGAGGSDLTSATILQSKRSRAMRFGASSTPVGCEGYSAVIGQIQNMAAEQSKVFLLTGAQGITAVLNVGDAGPMAVGAVDAFVRLKVGIYVPGLTVWTPSNDAGNGLIRSSDSTRFGEPSVAGWTWRLHRNGLDPDPGWGMQMTVRWYTVPGVRNAFYCEAFLVRDKTSLNATRTAYLPAAMRVVLQARSQPQRVATVGYDSTLDGVSMLQIGSVSQQVSWLFARSLTHPSAGHYYAAADDVNMNFATGALPTGVDTYTTVANTAYHASLSHAQAVAADVAVFRWVIGIGTTEQDAKDASREAPHIGPSEATRRMVDRVMQMPALPNATGREVKAFDLHHHNILRNVRTEQDWHPEVNAYDGKPRRLLFGCNGRWQAVWAADGATMTSALPAVDSDLVRDHLDYMFNNVMTNTGYLRADPTDYSLTNGLVQNGAFYWGRVAARYLAATSDTEFMTPLYARLSLMWDWWMAAAGRRHPDWPTVRLLTGADAIEVGEDDPTVTGGNFPSGELLTSVEAYDFCVSMAQIATTLGLTASAWTTMADAIKASVRTYCWDAGQGWFQSVMTPSSPSGGQANALGRFQAVKTWRAFYALYSGIPTPAQAATMLVHIMNTAAFKGAYGVRTAPANWVSYDPANWTRGGCRPYMDGSLITGLHRYGFVTEANQLLEVHTANVLRLGQIPEAINPDTGGVGYSQFYPDCAGQLIEASLMKCVPSLLYGVGSSAVTS